MLWLLLLIVTIGVIGYLRLSLNHATWLIGAWLVISAFANAMHGWVWLIWIPVLLITTLINIP